jgi:hypothetical protein
MEHTIAIPSQHLPLPYVPELPADFLRMLQSGSSQTAKQGKSAPESIPN